MKMTYVKHRTPQVKKCSSDKALYKTPDLYLSAFLRTKGVMLEATEEMNGKVVFIFQYEGNIQDLINEYFNDSSIGVLSYKAALRDLRSIIFDYQRTLFKKEK